MGMEKRTSRRSKKRGENIRDYASAEELIILINLESQNAELIKDGLLQEERFQKLRNIAHSQMNILLKNKAKEKLKDVNPNLMLGDKANKKLILSLNGKSPYQPIWTLVPTSSMFLVYH